MRRRDRRGGGRLRPQRARRRRHARARRPAVEVLEAQPTVGGGARTLDLGPGRRDHARHLLGRAPDGVGVPVLPSVRPAGARRRAAGARGRPTRTRCPAVGPGSRTGTWTRTVDGLGVDGAGVAVAGRVARPGRGGAGGARRQAVGAAGQPAWRRPGSGWACWSRARARGTAGSSTTSHPRCSPASRRTRSPRCPPSPPPGTALLLATLAHADGGWPIPRGGSGRDHRGAGRGPRGARRHGPHRPPRAHATQDLPARALLRVRHDPPHPRARARRPAPAAGPGGAGRVPVRRRRGQGRLRARRARCRGPCPRSGWRARCTSAARAPRWPARRTRSRAASTRSCR